MSAGRSALLRLALALLVCLAPAWAAAQTIQPGMAAPDFALPDADGQTRQLADWRGQWLVLYFYPRDNTPGCTAEAAAFRDALPRFAVQKAQIVGVSLDDGTSHRAFAEQHRLPFPLLVDSEGAAARAYGALANFGIVKFAKRHSFLIDPDGRVAKTYRDVEPSRHAEEIIADLKEFQR